MRRATGVRAVTVGAVALLGVLWPLTRSERHDSFPLSNYPMFTGDRPAETSFVRAIGVGRDGREGVLRPTIAGGTVEVIHANRTLRLAVSEGRAEELCGDIADRAQTSAHEIARVLIVTERYDVIAALRAEQPEPVRRDVHAACEVDA